MTILDYIATHPGCSGGEIAAALNTPTTAINAELRQLWRGGLVIRTNRSTGGRARKTGGQASYHVNPMPFGCGNPLTHMFNQQDGGKKRDNLKEFEFLHCLISLMYLLKRRTTPAGYSMAMKMPSNTRKELSDEIIRGSSPAYRMREKRTHTSAHMYARNQVLSFMSVALFCYSGKSQKRYRCAS